jgi:UDP-N-acetyl-D-mannosaminuronic acid dehydrogenase
LSGQLCVIGLGYIGLPTAAMFAQSGYNVLGVDINRDTVETINNGGIHIEEEGLGELVKAVVQKGTLRASTSPSSADIYIIAVPTPHNEDNTANLNYVIEATHSILPYIQKEAIIIVESTIPPRTIDDVVSPILATAGWDVGGNIYLSHCPERVLPGRILIELVENTRIIGGINSISAKKAAGVYCSFVKGDIIETSAVNAEMAKLMENTYRDVNIALANELAKISEKLEVNALEVIKLANYHPRVNLHSPGPGVGGHCLAVDPYFIIEKAPEQSLLISQSRQINNSMPQFVVDQIAKVVPEKGKIGILGLTYKGNIDDIRESPSLEVIKLLREQGYILKLHDPHVNKEAAPFDINNFSEIVDQADCLLVLTDHNEFKNLNEDLILSKMKNPIIVDTKNCVSINNNKINYYNYNNLFAMKKETVLI